MSPSCHCRLPVRSSIQPRMSGSICDRLISLTACSRPTLTFSMPAKTPGENFSPKPVASRRSHSATGLPPVNHYEGWYYTVTWHAVSEDTHRVKGEYSFGVDR